MDARVFAVQLAFRTRAAGMNDVVISIPDPTRLCVMAFVVALFGSAGWYFRRPSSGSRGSGVSRPRVNAIESPGRPPSDDPPEAV